MADDVRIGVFSCAGVLLLGALLGAGCGGGGAPITWKDSTTIPADFPKDVPVYPGAPVKHAITPDQGSGMVVMWETPDSVPTVQSHVTKELEAQGWTVSVLPHVAVEWMGAGGTTVIATRWGRQVSLSLGDKGGKTAITLVIPWRP